MNRKKILLLEDDEELGLTLTEHLRSHGYAVEVSSDKARALETATTCVSDLIILDATLSGRNRIEICRDIRQAGLTRPVLLVTKRGDTADTVRGLKLGADDCVSQPFEIPELLARVEALLRRRPLRTGGDTHHLGSLRIDMPARRVTLAGKFIFLTAREFELLRYLVEHPRTALARHELLREVWGYDTGTSTRTLDMHVSGLRRKLEKDPKHPQLILTVAGIGYQFGR
jgi:DNA-binding response OmpR family regulator